MISAETLAAIENLRQSDPVLRAVVDRTEVPPQESTGNVYEDALSCVLDMRIHYTARIDRLVERWQPHAALAARYLYRFRNPAKNK
jgi:hypothetical protein